MRVLMFLFIVTSSFATISGSIVWEFRTAGTANAGGGFKTGASGTDYSQQDAVQAARTDLVIGNPTTTELSSAGDAFAADDIGNLINITAGTNFTVGRYEITSVSGGVATVDRSVGTAGSTGGSGSVGGAIDLPLDAIFEFFEPGNIVYIKAGTYTFTESLSLTNDGTITLPIKILGYNATRGDQPLLTSRPLFALGALQIDLDDSWEFSNIRLTGSASTVLRLDNYGLVFNCNIDNTSASAGRDAFTGFGFYTRVLFSELSAIDTGVLISADGFIVDHCLIASGTTVGISFLSRSNSVATNNIINNSTNGIWIVNNDGNYIANNTFYSCDNGIVGNASGDSNTIIYNIFSDGVDGLDWPSGLGTNYLDYNNFFNNSGNDVTGVTKGSNTFALDPQFDDAASGDFNTGANMASKAGMANFPAGNTANLLDAGAAESTSGGGAATTNWLN